MKEHPLPNAQAYLMPKGHPYFEEIQWIINKVHESGLYSEWRKTDFGKENITTGKELQTEYGDEHKILKLYHLQSIFYVHFANLFISFVVFILEYMKK